MRSISTHTSDIESSAPVGSDTEKDRLSAADFSYALVKRGNVRSQLLG